MAGLMTSNVRQLKLVPNAGIGALTLTNALSSYALHL
jgi:hypothetical protein